MKANLVNVSLTVNYDGQKYVSLIINRGLLLLKVFIKVFIKIRKHFSFWISHGFHFICSVYKIHDDSVFMDSGHGVKSEVFIDSTKVQGNFISWQRDFMIILELFTTGPSARTTPLTFTYELFDMLICKTRHSLSLQSGGIYNENIL